MVARFIVVALLIASAAAALAETPVPPGCRALAEREGFPTDVLTQRQLAQAKVRMARLNRADPLVVECRAAIQSAQGPGQDDSAANKNAGYSAGIAGQ